MGTTSTRWSVARLECFCFISFGIRGVRLPVTSGVVGSGGVVVHLPTTSGVVGIGGRVDHLFGTGSADKSGVAVDRSTDASRQVRSCGVVGRKFVAK